MHYEKIPNPNNIIITKNANPELLYDELVTKYRAWKPTQHYKGALIFLEHPRRDIAVEIIRNALNNGSRRYLYQWAYGVRWASRANNGKMHYTTTSSDRILNDMAEMGYSLEKKNNGK